MILEMIQVQKTHVWLVQWDEHQISKPLMISVVGSIPQFPSYRKNTNLHAALHITVSCEVVISLTDSHCKDQWHWIFINIPFYGIFLIFFLYFSNAAVHFMYQSIQDIHINFWLNFSCLTYSSKMGIFVSNANKSV